MEKTNARINRFSQSTIENIGFYVYILQDPRDSKIFYIGKGIGNRVFDHVSGSLDNPISSDKVQLINEINKESSVIHHIVRHGLEKEETALEIESTLIDLFTHKKFKDLATITNIVAGHNTFGRGIKTVSEIEALYSATPLDIEDIVHNLLIININKTYSQNNDLYEATRKSWRLSIERVKKVDYVLAEYRGIVRGIFKPCEWHKSEEKNRLYFEGHQVLDKEIEDLYLNKMLSFKNKGNQNPLRYVFRKP